MGICETKRNSNTNELNEKTMQDENNKTIEKMKINQSIKNTKSFKTNIRVNECILYVSSLEKIGPQSKVSKSICKIKIIIQLQNQLQTIIGTGFLLKFYIDQECFYCLMSNEHVIKNDIIHDNHNIYIYYDNELKITNIKLDNKNRYIKSFNDRGLDITVVEILDEDNISKDYFLYPNSDTIINNKLINSKIYIPQYADGKELMNAKGYIININKYEFTHLASTEHGTSGSPIFLENSVYVIGIHKQSNEEKTENYGDFIYPAIDIIKNDIRERRNNGKYVNGKYIWEDGKYYIGQFKNNLPNGKGIKNYKNGNILYEGEFINGKFEGNGKIIWEDGEYYIGQLKNSLRNGKGADYYSNGNIKYEGDFVNDKYEGNGKYIWEVGLYYIGQWKNSLRNGKGTMYYSNGNIMYEGDFINGKFQGNGKYIWEDGKYYIGQWKNDYRNGKGTYYYSNGNIKYKGNFVNDKAEGYGKYIWENGEYYIGQEKNGLSNGKGIMYYSNGNIKYEGDFVNDKFEGNGKYIWEDGEYYIGQWKNDLRNGKGAIYYSNGTIMYQGNWTNDEFVGN